MLATLLAISCQRISVVALNKNALKPSDVTISVIGSATLWVTDQLTGNISGGGNVSYYGDLQTDIETSGLGQFKSLGSK